MIKIKFMAICTILVVLCMCVEEETETPSPTTTLAPTTAKPLATTPISTTPKPTTTSPPTTTPVSTEAPENVTISELRRVIEIKAEGEVLHYQRESFWSNEEFCELLKSKENFELKEIDSFKETLERYNRDLVNPKVEFDESKNSTTLICDIEDAKEGSWFDFDWLLRPYDLDFLDSNFERKEKEFYWKGGIDGVETVISIKFPYPISNCHEHVWPAK